MTFNGPLPIYDGSTALEEWLPLFDVYAASNGWDEDAQGRKVAALLEGSAFRVFQKVPFEQRNGQKVRQALQEAFAPVQRREVSTAIVTSSNTATSTELAPRMDAIQREITRLRLAEARTGNAARDSRLDALERELWRVRLADDFAKAEAADRAKAVARAEAAARAEAISRAEAAARTEAIARVEAAAREEVSAAKTHADEAAVHGRELIGETLAAIREAAERLAMIEFTFNGVMIRVFIKEADSV